MSDDEQVEGTDDELSDEAGEEQDPQEAAEFLSGVATDLAELLDKDLTALLGCQVTATAQEAKVAAGSSLGLAGGLHHQKAETDDGDSLHLVCTLADASALGAVKAGADAEVVKAARESASLDEHGEAFGEAHQLVAALLGSVFEKQEAGTLTPGESATQEASAGMPPFLAGECAAVAITLDLEGHDSVTLHLVVGVSGSGGDLVLFIVEPDADERERLEEQVEKLEREIQVVGPEELDDDAYDAMADAQGIVVAWDLAGRSGVELVEHLAREPGTREATLVLSHVQPTRTEVAVGLRAGARSLVMRPYDIEELDGAIRSARGEA